VLDPDEPSLLVLELQGGTYVERARGAGDEVLAVTSPFPLALAPAMLVT
jgi:hypothetical protein